MWFRLKPDTQLFFSNNGATKAFSANQNGHDGGVGGDVRLIVDPSVAKYNFEASLRGAPGQKNKVSNTYSHGAQGRDGNLVVEKKSVSW
jgi:GTPase involved in cell partitioning and DNA repair